MLLFGRITWGALAAAAALAFTGCSPVASGQMDEEKEAHFVLGKNRVNAMDYAGAVEAFGESLMVNPRSAQAHFQLACLFDTRIADPASAIYHYQEFLRLNPKADNAEVIKQRVYSCKQQLAADVLPLPSAPAAQQQLEKLIEKNRQLEQQLAALQEMNRQLAAQTNLVAPRGGYAPPDDVLPPPTGVKTKPGIPPAPKPKAATHTVAAGDTLAGIARKAGVSLTALQAANPGVSPKKLRIGQVLNLPVP